MHAFSGYTGGSSAGSPLTVVNGVAFGVAQGGTGPCQCGIVYRLDFNGSKRTFSPIYEFKGIYNAAYPDGSYPVGNLVAKSSGELFGVTAFGGKAGFGTVFKLTPSGHGYVESVLHSFKSGSDGIWPVWLLMSGASELYGVTLSGGTGENGTAFRLRTSGASESVIYPFAGGSDGSYPDAMVMGPSGALYGVTRFGGGTSTCGYNGCGTAFVLTPSHGRYTEKIIHAFQGSADGGFPTTLIAGSSGRFFGTTLNGDGNIFELFPKSSGYEEKTIYKLVGGSNGWGPASIALAADGTIFGSAQNAGIKSGICPATFGCGTIFELQRSGSSYVANTVYQFDGRDGSAPGGLTESGGTLYGVTIGGGRMGCTGTALRVRGCGTVFRLGP